MNRKFAFRSPTSSLQSGRLDIGVVRRFWVSIAAAAVLLFLAFSRATVETENKRYIGEVDV